MKQLFILLILLNFMVLACKEKEEENKFEAFPESLEQTINELRGNDSMCDICTVEIIEFNGERYYHLYCQIWSCIYCYVYDVDGIEVSFDQDDWVDFIENQKVIRTVPICQD